MWSIISTLLGFVPGFTNLIQKWFEIKGNVELAKVNGYTAVGSAAVTAAAQEAEGRAKTWGAISGSKLLLFLVVCFAGPIVIFEWKVVVWDTVLQWGTTDPVTGQVGEWMTTIIGSIFGSSTVLAVAHLWWTTKE